MTLLQVAAQTMAHKIQPSSPKIKPSKLFESKGAKIVAAAAGAEAAMNEAMDEEEKPGVSEWLQGARAEQAKPEEPAGKTSHKSVVEQYGEVAKGVSLKNKKRKASSGTKKSAVGASPGGKKRKKAVDEMQLGVEKY